MRVHLLEIDLHMRKMYRFDGENSQFAAWTGFMTNTRLCPASRITLQTRVYLFGRKLTDRVHVRQ